MKKLFILLTIFCSCLNASAQLMDIYKDGQLVKEYDETEMDRVVFREHPKLSTITLNKVSTAIYVNQKVTLKATVLPENAGDKTVNWSSSDNNIATVDANGVVYGVSEGSVTITCTANDGGGATATCTVKVATTTQDIHAYVDLGLPSGTLWARCNVGADSPEQAGDKFAWGETEPYSGAAYKYGDCGKGYYDSDGEEESSANCNVNKYCTNSEWGTVDNKTRLEAEDDAATANWGSNWCMPTAEQLRELFNSDNTTQSWQSVNGVSGYLIMSKTNFNTIFIPAMSGNDGDYWSSDLETGTTRYYEYKTSNGCAFGLYFTEHWGEEGFWINSMRIMDDDDWNGKNLRSDAKLVRPVHVTKVTWISLPSTSMSMTVGGKTTINPIIEPTYATDLTMSWTSSNTDVATVNSTGVVTAVAIGTATITCTANDGSGVSATCTVTITEHEYVDLGLPSGTLWATCNVGANSPEDYGDYFAWGETTPQSDNSYSWESYKWCNSSDEGESMTKYCTDSDYGTVDNKTELEASDDAATANWGSNWQMPSKDQIAELYNSSNTTTTWTTQNGVYGRLITSKTNSNTIFLPAAGCRSSGSLDDAGSYGYYWSCTLDSSDSSNAYDLYLYSDGIGWGDYYRYYGRSVRPVRVLE